MRISRYSESGSNPTELPRRTLVLRFEAENVPPFTVPVPEHEIKPPRTRQPKQHERPPTDRAA